MQILIILNEKPTTNEKAYNALRIAAQFQKDDANNKIVIYLLADGVICALAKVSGQGGVLNVEQMMEGIIEKGGVVKMCTSCGESRGLKEKTLITGVEWTNLKTLTDWILQSDRILNF
jgi:uncharacterized protein involved in oxidation of intracellular sulfur